MALGFLNNFKKSIEKMQSVTTDFAPPAHWFHTGNFALNRSLSGSYRRGIPLGRVSVLAGESGSGKSFLCGNIIREAQKDGAFIFVIDSENAMDKGFLSALGVDTSPDRLFYAGVITIQDVTAVLSEFITSYEKDYGKGNLEAPKVLIVLDSIDMLLTEAENEKFEKGTQTGDQGQRTKLIKHMLRTVVSRIARQNIAFLATHQVYLNQDVLNGQGRYIVNNAVRYSASQIGLITKLNLKEDAEIVGIKMRVTTYKSRFAKVGNMVEVMVPYDTGMNELDGVLESLVADGVVEPRGPWYNVTFPGTTEPVKFQKKTFTRELFERILSEFPQFQAEDDRVLCDAISTTEADEE